MHGFRRYPHEKIHLVLNAVLLGVIAYGGYKFIIEGSGGPSDDSRAKQ